MQQHARSTSQSASATQAVCLAVNCIPYMFGHTCCRRIRHLDLCHCGLSLQCLCHWASRDTLRMCTCKPACSALAVLTMLYIGPTHTQPNLTYLCASQAHPCSRLLKLKATIPLKQLPCQMRHCWQYTSPGHQACHMAPAAVRCLPLLPRSTTACSHLHSAPGLAPPEAHIHRCWRSSLCGSQ
jgi:hypothetical protein